MSPSPKKLATVPVSTNRIELFQPLNNELDMLGLTIPASQELVITEVRDVHGNPVQRTGNISPCKPNHEEADPKLITAKCLPVEHGFNDILVQSVDTDVAVLTVATVPVIDVIEI